VLLKLAGERRLLLFGGKGGVGKTTAACATAWDQAQRGRRVLLISTDPAHNLGHLWQQRIGVAPTALREHLDAVELDPQAVAEQHLAAVGAALRQLMPEHLHKEVDKHLALSRDAPGLHEAALLEKLAATLDEAADRYDLVVIDTAPSGHTARLMALPEMMRAWTEGLLQRQSRASRFDTALANVSGRDASPGLFDAGGNRRDADIRHTLERRRTLFERLRKRLADTDATAFIIVLTAERLPVLESIELQAQLHHAGLSVGALLINRRSPADQGEFLRQRRALEDAALHDLTTALPALPRIEIPLMPGDIDGPDALQGFVAALHAAG